ncbi:hypothetical protein [Streptomyces sp. SID3212]|uniref:hypothetical protein n=1 Tax=Streptomyces sp. SID3212 TaxID=2690259 RepID=UPI0019279A22|nr:hypothetical protein [Streptomyces sp. SID3212]
MEERGWGHPGGRGLFPEGAGGGGFEWRVSLAEVAALGDLGDLDLGVYGAVVLGQGAGPVSLRTEGRAAVVVLRVW